MNAPKALLRDLSSNTKPDRKDRQEFAPKVESAAASERPHRVARATPGWLDMLARVEGVARWGLNE